MDLSAAALRILVDGDFRAFRKHARDIMPHLAAVMPEIDDETAEKAMHMARTASQMVPLKLRAWSHFWLVERGETSLLPDELKPKAERIYPKRALAVGISVNFHSELGRLVAPHVRGAMEHAVLEADADGRLEDSVFVKARMAEARQKTMKSLLGTVTMPTMKGR